MRDLAIFSGVSNTFGLGLELEFRPKYQDDEWLIKNGMNMPNPREKEDVQYWKKYRWTKLVSDYLNVTEYNIHDFIGINQSMTLGGNSIETMHILLKEDENIKKILNRTKYIFLEIGWFRWWSPEIHKNNGEDYPNTVNEILNYIENPKSDKEVIRKAVEWLNDYDSDLMWSISFNTYKKLKENNPEIEFILVPWHLDTNIDLIDNSEFFINDIVLNDSVNSNKGIYWYLINNKLTIGDVAKCFNGDYKYNRKDDHPSSKGHQQVANMVINHVRKNNDLDIYKI